MGTSSLDNAAKRLGTTDLPGASTTAATEDLQDVGSTVDVRHLSDLPAAVAGVITLVDGTAYKLLAIIDQGAAKVMVGIDTELIGVGANISGFIGNSSDCLIEASNPSTGTINMRDILVRNDGSGDGMLQALSPTGIIRMNTCLFDSDINITGGNAVFTDCSVRHVHIDTTSLNVTFNGGLILATATDGLLIDNGSVVKAIITDTTIITGVGFTGIEVSPTATAAPQSRMEHNTFLNFGGTDTVGVEQDDWLLVNNTPGPNNPGSTPAETEANTVLTQQATTTARGTMELATAAEVLTGTDALRAVTPATLPVFGRGYVHDINTTTRLSTDRGNPPPPTAAAHTLVYAAAETGTYRVMVQYRWSLSAANRSFRAALYIDGVLCPPGAIADAEPSDASNGHVQTVTCVAALTAGDHTIILAFGAEALATATIDNSLIEVWRVV